LTSFDAADRQPEYRVINRGFDHQLVELRTQQGRELIGYVVLGRRTLHRSRENHEFWKWVYHYRRNSLPIITRAIATRAKHADVQSIVDETIIIIIIIDRQSASSFSRHCIVAWGVGGVIAASDWAGAGNVRVVLG
jgi:hypothetical protein